MTTWTLETTSEVEWDIMRAGATVRITEDGISLRVTEQPGVRMIEYQAKTQWTIETSTTPPWTPA
jgi:hypothetical protein